MIKFIEGISGYTSKKGNKILSSGINISAKKGELTALIGINGSGKSTLLKTLAGLHKILEGKILIDKKEISQYGKTEYAKKTSFVSSEIINVRYLKVFDTVSSGRFPYLKISSKLSEKDKKITEEALNTAGMLHFKDKYLNEISDGERQKVMIARALAQDTDIILLDEPAAFLDLENKFSLYKILSETVRKKNKTIIFSTHDLNIALKYCDKVWLIKDKKIYEGAPEDLVLNSIFKNIFDKENIIFNPESFEFSVKQKKTDPVNIVFNNKDRELRYAVINALSRKGFYPSDKKSGIKITVNEKNDYKINTDDFLFEAKNIYNLLNFVKQNRFNNT